MNLKFSTGTNHPIPEIENSYVCGLKKTGGEGGGKRRFSNQESEDTMSNIVGIKQLSGCSEVGVHQIYQK